LVAFGKQRKLVHPSFRVYTRTLQAVTESITEKPSKTNNLTDLWGPSLPAVENKTSYIVVDLFQVVEEVN
jgi:hypothetical protein